MTTTRSGKQPTHRMSSLLSSLANTARQALVSTGAGTSETIERLEERTLLSADLGPGGQWMDWGDQRAGVLSGSYILTFDDYLGSQGAELRAREAATRLGIQVESVKAIGRGAWAQIKTRDTVSFDAAQRVKSLVPGLRGFEPDRLYGASAIPNDSLFSDQWGLRNTGQFVPGSGLGTSGADIHATQAWDITTGSRDVIVAVIDTGIDVTHPDLIPNLWTNPGEVAGDGIDNDGNGFVDDIHGYDFGESDGNPQDDPDVGGHGTQVASVIGATGNDGIGVAGVAWAVSLMGLKIADQFGRLSTAAIIGAHDYATMMRQRGVNIVASNNSYGGFQQAFYTNAPMGFDAERDAITRFIGSGGTFVASSGNDGFDNDNPNFRNFPSSYAIPGLISVAATDNNDNIANFSNYGAQTVALAAPGVAIRMARAGGGYQYNNGTSFSSPMVAGAVALLKTFKPNASAVEIREALINSVDPLPSLVGKVSSGGRLNVARALQIIGTSGPVVRGLEPGSLFGQLQPGTTTPVTDIAITFSKDIAPGTLSTSGVSLIGAGVDGVFGGTDVNVPISAVTLDATNPRRVVISLNLGGFAQQRLPIDSYRLTLQPTAFRDPDGNFLNGNALSGTAGVHDFRVVGTSGENEPNDILTAATFLNATVSGGIRVNGQTLGNGTFGALDVDLYRLDLPSPGQISAEVIARRRPGGSSLDSYLRLFNALGQELTANDQFAGFDAGVDFFVNTAGTYYLGVSGFNNSRYIPAVGGSGSAQSLGVYDFSVAVTLSSSDVVSVDSSTDTGLPRRIPAAPGQTQGTTSSSISVSDSRQILDLNVRINLTHTFPGDLQISLIGPNGVEITLANRRGGDGGGSPTPGYINTVFDDEATIAIGLGSAPFTGSYLPEVNPGFGGLGAFDGINGNGLWTLRIVDASALNSGTLISWGLDFTFRNNIFGPFESNDTLATAKVLNTITGNGSATRDAFLGDGGFGGRDRDLFRFTADAGSSLQAIVNQTTTLNSALRLFDASGRELLVSNLGGTNESRIDGFIIPTAGTYYLGISESVNFAYNPTQPGSGVQSATTGAYRLQVTVSPGVSDPGTILTGTNLSVGINPFASFGTANSSGTNVGISFNGREFLAGAGTIPQTFFGAAASGDTFLNTGLGLTNDVSFALTSRSDSFNRTIGANGTYKNLRIQREFSFGASDSFIAIDVFLTNIGTSTLTGVSWMEGFNPNPGLGFAGESTVNTSNDVNGSFVRASYTNLTFPQGLTIALGAPAGDDRVIATVVGATTTLRDPSQILDAGSNDPNGSTSDGQIALAYNVGTIAPSATTRLRYFVYVGATTGAVQAMQTAVNNSTGTGHLTASVTGSGASTVVTANNPAQETLQTGAGPTVSVPQLPYRVYYPEGFFGDNIYTFVPISNPNNQPARVIVIARYELGDRDQLVQELNIPANSRSGITVKTPDILPLAGRANAPFALEIRSDRPVGATFSHYDLSQTPGRKALGEAFTSRVGTQWSFGEVVKQPGVADYLVFLNTASSTGKVTSLFYPNNSAGPMQVDVNVASLRRGGFAVNDATLTADYTLRGAYTLTADYFVNVPIVSPGIPTIAAGTTLPAGTTLASGTFIPIGNFLLPGVFGVSMSSTTNIVASLSHYDRNLNVAEGAVANDGFGATAGASPEGQYGINGTAEQVAVLNANTAPATVTFSFVFANGSSVRQAITIPANSYGRLDVSSIPNFPANQAYGISYSSTQPVAVNVNTYAYGDLVGGNFASQAYTLWNFAEGFRPADGGGHPGVLDLLRVYNPSATDTTIEITLSYDGVPGSETFRRVVPARRVAEFDLNRDFVSISRRLTDSFYTTTIKGASPVVAYMDHYDRFTPDALGSFGAFGTLGTPLGIFTAILPDSGIGG